nr:hypothetical protein [uncultured Niameybacter sp.]
MSRVDIIGTIAKEDIVWREYEGTKQTVFLNGNNQLQYSVQCLTTLCGEYENIKFFTGYLGNLEKYGFEEDYYEDVYTRVSEFKEIVENYLFIFNPIESGGHMRIDNVALTIKPHGYEDGMTFESVPYYTSNESLESFIQRWQKDKYIQCSTGLSEGKGVSFILWQPTGTTRIYCIGGDKKIIYYQDKLYCPLTVNTYELANEEKQKIILNPRSEMQELAFVETGLHDSLVYQKNEKLETKIGFVEENTVTNIHQEGYNHDDLIIQNLKYIINNTGFRYSKQDLMNFHTALKTKSLVILEGMSGTGKSRLVDFYRQALGLDEKHYKCISVKASWTDESDLLGYPDMMNSCYRPDHEGVVDLLLDAEKNPEELYLLCFDEMNLARVEHYFSQFLSILEMDKKQQVLRLYNDILNLSNKEDYPATIALKGNVLFVGTINKDESTHHFSDKVLDRANVINLGVVSLKDLYTKDASVDIKSYVMTNSCTRKNYFGEPIKPHQVILTEGELEVLENVHQMLMSSQYDKGIGYRIIRQIEEYLYNLPKDQSILSREEAFDLQFTQRILSKLRGDRMSLEGVLIGKDEESIPLIECLDAYKHVSSFEKSKKVILQKVKALKCYGYTM